MRPIAILAACILGAQGCSASPTVLEFEKIQSPEEQRAIAEYYRNEAAVFRQKASGMAGRVAAYRQLFGEDSEWVSGARLLSEYYEQEARERERLADQYQSSMKGRVSSSVLSREGQPTRK